MFNNVIPILSTVFGFLAIAGGAAGYFKASRGDSIIKYQATEITLRDGTITNLKADLAAATQGSSVKDETIKKLEEHNKFLQKLGQGSPQLKKLTDVQQKLVTSIDNQTKAITALLEKRV